MSQDFSTTSPSRSAIERSKPALINARFDRMTDKMRDMAQASSQNAGQSIGVKRVSVQRRRDTVRGSVAGGPVHLVREPRAQQQQQIDTMQSYRAVHHGGFCGEANSSDAYCLTPAHTRSLEAQQCYDTGQFVGPSSTSYLPFTRPGMLEAAASLFSARPPSPALSLYEQQLSSMGVPSSPVPVTPKYDNGRVSSQTVAGDNIYARQQSKWIGLEPFSPSPPSNVDLSFESSSQRDATSPSRFAHLSCSPQLTDWDIVDAKSFWKRDESPLTSSRRNVGSQSTDGSRLLPYASAATNSCSQPAHEAQTASFPTHIYHCVPGEQHASPHAVVQLFEEIASSYDPLQSTRAIEDTFEDFPSSPLPLSPSPRHQPSTNRSRPSFILNSARLLESTMSDTALNEAGPEFSFWEDESAA